jgi:DNA-directed RNA polymerase beta subunit/DNA-directed RNA polymerase beta' subunit
MSWEKSAASADNIEEFYQAEPEQISRQIEQALHTVFPLTSANGMLTLSLVRVWVDAKRDLAQQPGGIAEARYNGTSYSMPIQGEFVLTDGTKEINRHTWMLGPYFPIVPTLGTRLINGALYQNKLQFRRQPGAYPMRNSKGEALVEFNTAKGRNFNLGIDLKGKDVQTVDILFPGGSRNKVSRGGYALLRALGRSDKEIRAQWGDDIWRQNALDQDGEPISFDDLRDLVDQTYSQFADRNEDTSASASFPEAARRLKERLASQAGAIDPAITRQTLGVEKDHIDGEVMLEASKQLLSVYAGEDPAHRFSERFRTVHSVATQVREALTHHSFRNKFVGKIQRRLNTAAERSSFKGLKIADLMSGAKTPMQTVIRRTFTNSDLSSTTETNNIADIEARSKEITIRGPGGIRSSHAITDENIGQHPSRLGLAGMVKTQVASPGTVIPLAMSAVIDGDSVKRRVYDRKERVIRAVTSEDIEEGNLAFPDEFERVERGGKVTYRPLKKMVMAAVGDDVREVDEKSVRYVIADQSDLFSLNVNATPFLGHNSGPRVIMGTNQMTQAIALKNPEAPLVRSVDRSGTSFDETIGRRYNLTSPISGTVSKVGHDSINLIDKRGELHTMSVLRDVPLNQGSFLDQTPVVKKGDPVTKGQLLTSNNYTDSEGALAIGRNMRVGYMPMDGWNHEDGIVMSQSGADKLTSVHMKEYTVAIEENDAVGVGNYNTYLKSRSRYIDGPNAAKLDEDGLVRQGETVEPGEVIAAVVGRVKAKESPEFGRQLVKIFDKMGLSAQDKSKYWEDRYPGTVVKVVKAPNQWRIFIKVEQPFRVGDKVTGRYGEKGIVSLIMADKDMPSIKNAEGELEPLDMIVDPHGIPCFDPETEMLTRRGWIAMPDIEEDDVVATLNKETFDFEWQEMEAYHANLYKGPMYEIKNNQVDLRVTPNHKMFVTELGARQFRGRVQMDNPEARAQWSLQKAEDIVGERKRYLKVANWKETDFVDFVHIPAGSYGGTCPSARGFNFYPNHWAEFIGWYVTEGSCYQPSGRVGSYRIEISQSKEANPVHYDRIHTLLTHMGITFQETKSGFMIHHKGLYEVLEPLGKSADKHIPRNVLDMPRESLRLCLDAMISGDGCVYNNEKTGHKDTTSFVTTSRRLAGDMQELAIKLGIACNIRMDKRADKYKTGECFYMAIQKNGKAPWTNWSDKEKANQHEAITDYEGMVYCPTVPNGVVMVRRDGKAVWSGNSRANPGQVLEIAAGKIAKKTGMPYLVKNFDAGALERVRADLAKNGLTDKDTVFDPKTGRNIPGIATGYAYKAKLRHQLDKKFNVRHTYGDGFDSDEQPIGGAAIDKLTLYGLIGHNARANLSEMANLKGTKNTAYWAELAEGKTPPRITESPFAFNKMKALLEGMGVSIDRNERDELAMIPLTDKEVLRASIGEVKENKGFKTLKQGITPEEAGLFDPKIVMSDSWNHIELAEPTPNPLFIKPISMLIKHGGGTNGQTLRLAKNGRSLSMSSMVQRDVKDIYIGERAFEIDGEEVRGGLAIQSALKTVDLDATIEKVDASLRAEMAKPKINATAANSLHATLRFAKMLKAQGIRPEEAYVMTKVPVLPPIFRQPIEDSKGNIILPDTNKLYGGLISDNNLLKYKRKEGLDDEMLTETRRRVYDSYGALVGASGSRNTGDFAAIGIADQLASPKSTAGAKAFDLQDGDSSGPKGSFPQKKVVKKRMELSGRTTIIPDPDLDVDQAGIPEEAAWSMYEPFVRNELARRTTPIAAKRAFDDRTPMAYSVLEEEMERRPVMLNRAPSWWQYNMMAFKPKLIKASEGDEEKALRVPGLVVGSYYGGDYDGDALNMHVPVEPEAVHEAWTMLPSRHLRSVGSKSLMIVPDQSMLLGLYHMTGWDTKGKTKTITNLHDALRGDIKVNAVVRYQGRETTIGWEQIDEAVRKATGSAVSIDTLLEDYAEAEGRAVSRRDFRFDKPTRDTFLDMLSRKHTDRYAAITGALAKLGDHEATRYGVSVGLSDLSPMVAEVKKYTEKADRLVPGLAKEIAALEGRKHNDKDMDAARVQLYTSKGTTLVGGKKIESVQSALEREIKNADPLSSQLIEMMQVGSKGNATQMRQILAAPLMVKDVSKRIVPVPVKNSYAGGLTTSEYFIQQHGTLSGLRDRAVETSRPGDIGKQLLSAAAPLVVTESDCGTTDGTFLSLTDSSNRKDVLDRVMAVPAEGFPAGTVIDGRVYAALKSKTVKVRSPLTCEADDGVCQKCFGLQPDGRFPDIGENVGVQQAQALIEPLTRLTLKSFHTSGSATGEKYGIDRVEEVFRMKTPKGHAVLLIDQGQPRNARLRIKDIEEKRGAQGLTGTVITFEPEKGGYTKTVRLRPDQHRKLHVVEGALLENGTPLSDGPIDPSELRSIKGFRAVQEYITDEVQKAVGVNRRSAETMTAAMSRLGTVTDPGSSDFTPFDRMPIGQIRKFNREADEKGTHRIRYEPEMFPVATVPKQGDDWIPKLDFRNVKEQIISAGSTGARSAIHGANPISAYIFGREMDRGKSGGWRY